MYAQVNYNEGIVDHVELFPTEGSALVSMNNLAEELTKELIDDYELVLENEYWIVQEADGGEILAKLVIAQKNY